MNTAPESPCIICEKPLSNVWKENQYLQPNNGVVCSTTGNYGSTVFDTMGWEPEVSFCICDKCFVILADKGLLLSCKEEKHPSTYIYKPYEVSLATKLWSESETHEEYQEKLKQYKLKEE